ncbi:class I adenylate-forming enzyme family protein [Ruminococcus sp.]|uniref:class I adenylate-forming enzyme family protein n=1 Tax=Ruminococcus sp. TaxID=41978 RepID=UPI0028730320|nr:class I adenylate-forming enzyme family protein [Ruminococcus sp.]
MSDKLMIDYPALTMYQMVERTVKEYPDDAAIEFYGKYITYKELMKRIERCAKAFTAMGIGKGDAVTLCLPNIPQTLECFYALNRIGAICNMVHPQSAQKEITYYLDVSESKAIVTVDLFFENVSRAIKNADHAVTAIICRMQNELPLHLAAVYLLKKGKSYLKYPNTENSILYRNFLKGAEKVDSAPVVGYEKDRTAAILYSGGTSGLPKGICLTDLNFNACAMQSKTAMDIEITRGMRVLSCMPMFHGFGLGINIHVPLIYGACCMLMPTFNKHTYAKALVQKRPNFIAGVPTIFEALLHLPELEGKDLSYLLGMFCGGDSLSVELKKKIDKFLKEHHADIQVREGYGLTECVTASCLTPKNEYRENSIGLPYPDTYYQIVRPGTDDVLPFGEEGEIILRGPSVMTRYLKNPEETANTLRQLADGNIWLYTGDLGSMDEDGYVYFKQRIKRMIITNGYNVYPGPIENLIDGVDEVAYSCVIGVRDPRRMQRVRAYVVLHDGVEPTEDMKQKIMDVLKLNIAVYALPKEIVFRDELPKTLVGKVAYRKLEDEANAEEENA